MDGIHRRRLGKGCAYGFRMHTMRKMRKVLPNANRYAKDRRAHKAKLWKMGYVPSGIKEMAEITERDGKPY